MSIYAKIAILALMSISITPLSASIEPTAPSESITEILVIGEKQRKKRINSFIRSAMRPSKNDQYARYKKRICPVAMGLPEEHNRVIEQRMLQVAKAAGIRTAKAGCRTNMGIVVINDTNDFMAELRRKHPLIFNGISIVGRDRIMAGPGPAYAWNIVETRGGDSTYARDSSGQMSNAVGTNAATGGGGILASQTSSPQQHRSYRGTNSRLTQSVRQDLNMSVVLIEKSALEDINLRQIADYGLLRLLTDTRDMEVNEVSERSILTLFSDRNARIEPALSITAWDFSALKALYKIRGNQTAARQRNSMARIFEKELVRMAVEESEN